MDSIDKKPAAVACSTCRRAKMKCFVRDGESRCERCKRADRVCVFEAHRRGQWRRNQIAQRAPEAQPFGSLDMHDDLPSPPSSLSTGAVSEAAIDPYFVVATQEITVSQDNGIESKASSTLNGTARKDETEYLDFHLDEGARVGSSTETITPDAKLAGMGLSEDPVEKRILNLPAAQNLFDAFFKNFNYLPALLDPELFTFRYTRARSPLLFTVVLSVAAKIFRPDLHQTLRGHAEGLLGRALLTCDSSIENIWAIMCFYHWKDVGDKRGYNLVGFALRMARSADWHMEESHQGDSDARGPAINETEEQVRQRRDKERIWMVLGNMDSFCYYFSNHPQGTVPFYNSAASRKWLDLDPWCYSVGDARAIAGNELHRIARPVYEYTGTKDLAHEKELDQSYQGEVTLMKTFNADLSAWGRTWGPIFRKFPQSQPCLEPLIYYYEEHLRLYLNSVRLARILSSHNHNISHPSVIESIDICYASALRLLEQSLIVAKLDVLYYLWDMAHLMTAYSAGMILKLLRLATNLHPSAAIHAYETVRELSSIYTTASVSLHAPAPENHEEKGLQVRQSRNALDAQSRWLRGIVAAIELDILPPFGQSNGGVTAGLENSAVPKDALPDEYLSWTPFANRLPSNDSAHWSAEAFTAPAHSLSISQLADEMGLPPDLHLSFLDSPFLDVGLLSWNPQEIINNS